MQLKSPWVHQLVRTRPIYTLEIDLVGDICIIGGGISGMMSAYHILKYTNRNVVLVDAREVGHGATGHNAGQLVDELERSVFSLVEDFGLEKTIDALKSIRSAWIMLDEIMQDASISVPYSTFEGYNMYMTKKQIHDQLIDISLMYQGGMHPKKIYIAEEFVKDLDIPNIYTQYYEVIPHTSLLSLGQTINPAYIAAYPHRKGCLNSALFVEQLAQYLVSTYSTDRFKIYEKTSVSQIDIDRDIVAIQTENKKTIACNNIILCTNGFEHFNIRDIDNDINYKYHKNVKGVIGYMLGQTEEIDHTPSAFMYCDLNFDTISENAIEKKIDTEKDIAYAGDYIYTTRRPYDIGHEEPKNLFCIGGKAIVVEDTSTYDKDHEYHSDVKKDYEDFINENFGTRIKPDESHREFLWHGLMGYTANGLRMVGFEKKNKLLMYNVGCNGIGILPAIWSGKRITDLLLGDTMPSLFDPA